MCTRQCLTVLAAVALGACAAARSDTPDQLLEYSPGLNKLEKFYKSNIVDRSVAQLQLPDSTRSVNKRFPSAVLYGGTCGGTIISPTWILTAAHCTLFSTNRIVIAGTNNTKDGSGVLRYVKRLVIHPLFAIGPYWLNPAVFNIKQVAARWDFLLAELTEPLPVDGITIAAANLDERLELPEGLKVGYAGYGTNHFGGTMSSAMHGMSMAVQANSRCATLLQYNSKDMLCAQGLPPRLDSACNGDSGSGLIDQFGTLLGVASWVEDDAFRCFNGALVVFSRVAAARSWIKEVTGI